MEWNDLTGKVAIVTGGSSGIGRETCVVLAEHGATVAVAARRVENDPNGNCTEAVVQQIRAMGGSAYSVYLDTKDQGSITAMVQKVIDQSGHIDILVNCAGVAPQIPLLEVTQDQWDDVLDANARGTFFISQAVIPHMQQVGGGTIVNVSSQAGQVGGWIASVPYSASKGGILATTKALARFCAPYNIRVNDVAPGLIVTAITEGRGDEKRLDSVPLGRRGTSREVANAIYFLASDLSSYITGTTIDINGGMFMRS